MPHRDTLSRRRKRTARRAGALAAAACLAATTVAAGPFGIPLERQPFIKVCPDGTIVGSFGPNLSGEPTETIGASIFDPRTGTTTLIPRDAPDFEKRLAANSCVRKPIGRDSKR